MGHVELTELNISSDLLKKLDEWDLSFQKTFSEDYPPQFGFKSAEEIFEHDKRSNDLANSLQRELGTEFVVEFQGLIKK